MKASLLTVYKSRRLTEVFGSLKQRVLFADIANA